MRSIYVAATGQNAGKTTVSLGLLSVLKARGVKCQYFKPIGQHFADHLGRRADEDAWLCREVLGAETDAELMSPVIVSSGYVAQYLTNPKCDELRDRILRAEKALRAQADVLVTEGTGHAGVGSCLDLSNAVVAKMLDAVVVIVVPGGVGRSLDEVALNQSLFKAHGVEIAGVIANKIQPDKYEKVNQLLRIGCQRLGTRLLGAIPYEPLLSYPTVGQILEELDARLLCGRDRLGAVVENTIIAAMNPLNVLRYLRPGSLVITPGDRVDNILLAMSADRMDAPNGRRRIAGVVLTGGFMPHMSLVPLLRNAGFPVLLCEEDTFSVASRISQWAFKMSPGDSRKIAAAQAFVWDYVDVEYIVSLL
jgi:hypothetical protein